MKKFYYSLFAAASMMLAVTSCSQEEDFVQSSSEMTTFSISLDEAAGSRATNDPVIGDGTKVNQLHYVVYNSENSTVVIDKAVKTFSNKTVQLELPLMKSEKYDILFWAQASSAADIYTTTDLRAIKINYGYAANREDADAFFNALDGFTADGGKHKVVLRRPFAQLNVATTVHDWTEATEKYNKNNGTTGKAPVTKSKVTVSKLASTFDVLTGKADGATSTEVIFTADKIEELLKDANNISIKRDGTTTSYKLLAMNYLLPLASQGPDGLKDHTPVGTDAKDVVEVEFTLYKGDNGEQEIASVKVPSTPIQRNYRTNIIGDLLTGEEFDIVIDEIFDKPDHDEYIDIKADGIVKKADGYYITNKNGFEAFANLVNYGSSQASRSASTGYTFEGMTFVLDCDIDLAGAEWTPIGSNGAMFSGTFDGNGKTVSNFKVDVKENGGLFGNVQKSTIKDLKVQTANIKSTHYAGGIAAHGVCAKITGCTVEDITITVNPSVKIGNDYNGDKAGGIIGYLCADGGDASLMNCKANKVTITAYRDFGGIVGYTGKSEGYTNNPTISGNSVGSEENSIVLVIDNSNNYKEYTQLSQYNVGEIIGRNNGATGENTTPADEAVQIVFTGADQYPGYYQDAEGNYIATEDLGITNLIKEGVTDINLADGQFEMSRQTLGAKAYTISGSRNANLDMTAFNTNGNQSASGATLNIEGITLSFKTNDNYNGFTHTNAVSLKDCAIQGNMFLYSPTTFENCDFNSNGAEHCVWTYGAPEVSFTNCTFTYGDRAVNCYLEDPKDNTVTVNVNFLGCKFTKVAGKETTGAIETNSWYMKKLNLNITDCNVNEGNLWWISKWNNNGGSNTVVTVDGLTYVAENLWKNQAGEYVANTPDALVAIFKNIKNGDIIRLVKDLDMTGKSINATNGNVSFTLYGDNKTISNLNGTEQGLFVNNTGSAVYKFYNVKLQGCSVESSTNYGALFVGDADTCDELIIEGCEVNNCTVKSAKYAAAFVGYTAGYNVQNNGPVYSDVTIKDCKVVGGSITGGGSTAAAIGHAGGNVDTTNEIKNLNVSGVAINGEDAEHTGIVVGTANVGKTYITDATYNNVTGNYNTEHPLFGRFVPGTTGKLTIDNKQIITDNSQLAAAIKDNATIELGKGNYTLPNDQVLSGKTLTISGTKETVIATGNGNNTYANLGGANITFEGVTIEGQKSGQYNGFAHAGKMTYKKCTFEGTITIYSNTIFEECTFNLPKDCYVWTSWGASEVTYEKCTFNTAGKALLMYHENGTSTLNVNNCTFNATTGAKAGDIKNQNCAAIEIGNHGKGVGTNTACNFTLKTSGNTIDSDFSGEWRIKAYDPAGSVTVNGTEYNSIALDGKTMTIDSDKNVTVN